MRIYAGTYFKIPLFVHWSWFLLPPLIALSGLVNVAVMIAAFFFVILHEYGHCLMAKYLNLTVKDVTLYPIGGVAQLQFPPGRAKEEFLVAVAGPFVNLVLAALFMCAIFFVPVPEEHISLTDLWVNYPAYTILIFGFSINVVMLVFNMLPVIPMDGGRVFRSCLTCIIGYKAATLFAVRFAQAMCVGFIFLGFYLGNPWFPLIFFCILLGAQNELVAANHYTNIHSIKWKVGLVLGRPELADAPLSQVIGALEDVEDSQIKEFLQTEDLIPLLKDVERNEPKVGC